MRHAVAAALLLASTALAAAIPVPERAITDPRTIVSPADPAAGPVPLEDLVATRGMPSVAWSADGTQIFAVTSLTGRLNIWRMEAGGSWPVQLTQSDERQTGLTVAPDGKTLWFLQDRGGDEQYDVFAVPVGGGAPLNLTDTPDLREDNLRASRSGAMLAMSTKRKADGQLNLAVMDLATRQARPLTREADPQMRWTPVAWVDGDRAIIANRVNPDDTLGEVWRVEVADGRATRLIGKAATYYHADDATGDGARLLVTTTEGSGRARTAVYETAAKRWRWIAATPWQQTGYGFSPDGRTVAIETSVDGRTAVALHDAETLAATPVALPPGLNFVSANPGFSPDGTRLLAFHAGGDAPLELHVYDVAAQAARQVTRLAPASLATGHLPRSHIVSYRSFDGTPVSAVLTMPFNLQRDGGNPAVLIPHGGPTGQTEDSFSRLATALASRGYLVIQPNPRGSTGYGEAFQIANRNDLGGGDLKDELAARDFLIATGYADPKRIGITGGSYGGFMTLMAIGRAPDVFAAAVQSYGIINWRTMWDTSDPQLKQYLFSLLGDPARNGKVYDATSPLTYIAQARAPLLSLQGENDIRVPAAQARELAALLKDKGVTTETVFYPAEGHGFLKRENQIDALRRTVDWFERHLKPAR